MTTVGLRKPGTAQEPEEVLAYLAEAQAAGGPLWVEDAQGREVPARLEQVTRTEVKVVAGGPLGLDPGAGTHLLFILYDLRFKAPALVLACGEGAVSLALPLAVQLAERRKKARGYLNFALLGLFSPLAAWAAPPEPSYHFAYETTLPAMSLEKMAGGLEAAEPTNPERPRQIKVDSLLQGGVAPKSNLLVYYMRDWMQSHSLAPRESPSGFKANPAFAPELMKARHRGGLLSHGITYNFMSLSYPSNAHSLFSINSVKLETHIDRNGFRLGIRIK